VPASPDARAITSANTPLACSIQAAGAARHVTLEMTLVDVEGKIAVGHGYWKPAIAVARACATRLELDFGAPGGMHSDWARR